MDSPGNQLSIDVTTTGLIASIKRRGYISAGSGLENSDILQYATEELRGYITAFLKGIREEFIVTTLDISITSGTIAAPVRAVGAALRTIGFVMSDGRVRFLPRIEPENAGQWAGQTGEPVGYMFRGNSIILLPTPSSGTLRLTYQQRPGQLVSTDECGLISSVSASGGGMVTLVTRPDGFNTVNAFDINTTTGVYDFVKGTANFTAPVLDFTCSIGASDWTGTTCVVGTSNEALLAIGDYMCLAGETCIPQIPTEVHDLLAQATAYKIAQATGSKRVDFIKAGLDELNKQMTLILSPRSDGSARPIVSRSRIGLRNVGW